MQLTTAMDEMTCGGENSPVAPVDLSQAIIGPGMAVFSQYAAVLEADGTPVGMRTALQLINRYLAEDDFDHDTQFCFHWFQQSGFERGPFGAADVLARAKFTSVAGVASAGVVESGGGKVRLLRVDEYPITWDKEKNPRVPVWRLLHQLIQVLRNEGERKTGKLLAEYISKGDAVRQLAYRLYTICERKGDAEEARPYNELIASWQQVDNAARASREPSEQLDMFGGTL